MKFFRRMTMDHPLIMGRTTFDSVGILDNRHIYVLTNDSYKLKQRDGDGFQYISASFIKSSPSIWKDAWVCGGAQIYKLLFPYCSDLYLTILLDDYEGTTYMPDFEHLFPQQRVVRETKSYWIVHYWKIDNLTSVDMFLEEAKREGLDWKLMVGQHPLWKPWFNEGFSQEISSAWLEGYQSVKYE